MTTYSVDPENRWDPGETFAPTMMYCEKTKRWYKWDRGRSFDPQWSSCAKPGASVEAFWMCAAIFLLLWNLSLQFG